MGLSVTVIIIIITVAVSLYAGSKPELYSKLLFNPYQVVHRKEWYRIFSHALIHSKQTLFHLGVNMYVLYSFGSLVEQILTLKMGNIGILYYLLIYIGGVFFATLPALTKHKDNYGYNSVGASGAVSAVLFSSIAFIPFSGGIGLLFIPISIPPLVFGVLYVAYEAYMDKKSNDNVAHDAHIWGAVYGFLFTLVFVPKTFSNFINELLSVF